MLLQNQPDDFRRVNKPYRGKNRPRRLEHRASRTSDSDKCSSSRSSAMMAAWFVLIGLFVSVPVWSAEYPAPLNNLNVSDTDTTEAGMALFDRARTNLWAATGSPESDVRFLDRAASTFESVSDPAAQAYLLARVELYRGRIALDTESKSSARAYFERSMELAEQSIDITESAEALRVLSDAGSSWMITKGLGGIIKMAPQVQEWSARAVEMDPENALAIIISTQGQINAPKSAGGDPDEAARRLVLLNSRTDLGDIERFWARVSLSQAYKKLKRRDDAAVWCRKAAEIFPQSPMLEECS